MRELRTDQSQALEELRIAVGHGKRRVVMQAPTGYGKTVLASALITNALAKGKKVLFTVPAISLIDQVVESFWEHGIEDIGVIQAHHAMTNWSKPVQVASVQTLMKRPMPDADVVMLDECHRWFTAYRTWLHAEVGWKAPVIGLSATPWTRGLGNYYDHYIRATTTAALIEAGLLSPYRVYARSHPDLSEVRTVAGDYHEGELSAKMSDAKLVGDAVATWLAHAENRPTLCYAVDCAHAKHLQARFQAAGVSCGYQDAYTKEADRRSIKRDFHNGALKVVCNVGTLTTGIDWDVRCISLNRPTKSDMLFVQIVGRGLRTAEGKDHCLILDHSDNHMRLGFVTDVDASYTGLLKGKAPVHDNRTEAIKLPKECPSCTYLKPPGAQKCPQCGFVAQVQCSIKAEAGDLRVLKPKPKPVEAVDKPQFYAELKAYAQAKQYKSGWASNQYREKFGTWPDWRFKDCAPSLQISATVAGWIKSRQIAYAKGKALQKQRELA